MHTHPSGRGQNATPRCGEPGGSRTWKTSELVASGHPAMRQCPPLRRNRYAAPCSICGHQVDVEAGGIEYYHGQWVVWC